MIFLRNDKQCKAEIIVDKGDTLLIRAFWPAKEIDHKKFSVKEGIAQNILNVKRADFDRRFSAM